MPISLTVGKVDAGVAILLTEDKRHIEFPSILLPSSITSGSIVDITVRQNTKAEEDAQNSFQSLQEQIVNTYGLVAPTTPVLRLRNATQTSLVLEWDPIQLATSTLRSLALYRNGSKAGNIPRPMEMLSTKISGLAVDSEYSFYLVLRTSGGTYHSNTLTVKTHKMTDLTGITITPGVLPPQLKESLEIAVERIGAKIVDSVRIDTTHFVCTEGRGADWEKAVENNIPVVRPEWIEGCEREGKIVGVRGYYLDANPKHRQVGSNPVFTNQQPQSSQASVPGTVSQTSLPRRSIAPRSPEPEGGEPGPEVPPTPPPKRDDAPPVPPKSADDDDSEDEPAPDLNEKEIGRASAGDSDEESEDEGETGEKSVPPLDTPKVTSVNEKGDGAGDMEDVAL